MRNSSTHVKQNCPRRLRLVCLTCTTMLLFTTGPAAQAQVTPGADLEFDAASNPQDLGKTGAEFWYPSIDTLPAHDLGGPREYVWFGEGNTSITPNVVSDPAFPGITHSYAKGGTGRNRDDITGNGVAAFVDGPRGWAQSAADTTAGVNSPDTSPGTFEVWFNNNTLSGGEQAILEWGGGGRGAYFSLVNDEAFFYVNGDGGGGTNNAVLSATLTTTGWHQMVGIFHNVSDDNTPDDFLSLYIDGQKIADTSASPIQIDRWSGGNAWGVGEIGVSNDPISVERVDEGPMNQGADTLPNRGALDGDVAIVRYYWDQVLTDQEVLNNYNGIAASDIPGDFDSDGDVDGADFLTWQRINATPGGLAEWENNYPTPLVAASVAVPEPSAFLLISCGAMFCVVSKGRNTRARQLASKLS